MEERNRLYGDSDIVMAAVKQRGWALKDASVNVWRDSDIVMAAVSSVGMR